MKKSQIKSSMVAVRLSLSLRRALEKLAQEEDRTLSSYIRLVLSRAAFAKSGSEL